MVRFTYLLQLCYKTQILAAQILACCALFLLINTKVYGEEPLLTEQDYMPDVPMVLSATRLPQNRADAPVSITVIDRDMIDASGAVDLADLMRLVPGFQVAMVNGNTFAVTTHGDTYEFPRKLQVLIDGRSVYRPLLSNVDWVSLGVRLSDVERIEVIRGPSVSVYGTNAFLGTINIITKQPFQYDGLYGEMLSGSQGRNSALLTYASSDKKLSYRMTLEHSEDDGFDNVNDGRNINVFSLKQVYDFSQSNSVDLQFGYNKGELGAWGESDNFLNPVRNKDVTSYYGYLRYNHKQADQDWYVQFYHNNYTTEDRFTTGLLSKELGVDPLIISAALGGRPDQPVSSGVFDGIAKRSDLELQRTSKIYSKSRFVWGVGLRRDEFKSDTHLDSKGTVTDDSKRIFGQLETWLTDKTIFNLAAMVEDNNIADTNISPRIGLNYHLTDNQSIRVSATHAQRVPSLFEKYQNWTIRLQDGSLLKLFYTTDKNLKPEKITSYEMGYFGSFYQSRTTLDIKLFKEQVDDIIIAPLDEAYKDSDFNLTGLDSNKGTRVWQNGGNSTIKGLEAEFKYMSPAKSLLYIAYAYSTISGESIGHLNPTTYKSLSGHSPKNTLTALYQQPLLPTWKGSVVVYYVDDMEWLGDGDNIKNYTRVDARVAKEYHVFGINADFSGIVQNVFDKQYQEFSDNNIFERRAYLQLKMNF